MAEFVPKIVDTGFLNWIKANLALKVTKDGIKDAVRSKVNTFHQDALNDILTPEQIQNNDCCTRCTLQNIMPCRTKELCSLKAGVCSFHQSTHYRPCPKGICDRLKDKIKQCHKCNMPSWKNTRPERWCDNPWELAKCYIPKDGYTTVNTIEETDLNGILSLLLNHTAFKRIVDEQVCREIQEIIRRERYSLNRSIDENAINIYLDKLVRFLSSSSLFQADVKATESVRKLKQVITFDIKGIPLDIKPPSLLTIPKIQADSLTIASEDEVLQDVIQEAARGFAEKIKETVAQLAREAKAEFDILHDARSKRLKEIAFAKFAALSDIRLCKHEILSVIQLIIKEIDDTSFEIGSNDVRTISQIDKQTHNVVEDLESAISEIDKSKDVGISEIGNSKDHAISEIDKKVQTGVEDIKIATEELKLEARSDTKLLVQPSSKEMQQAPAMNTDAVYRQLKNDEVMLGTQDDLDMKWAQFRISGEGFEKIQYMCSTICSYIKNKSDNIQHVWPAYVSTDCDRIMFVIVSKDEMDSIPLELEYATVLRPLDRYSKEASAVMQANTEGKGKYDLASEDAEKIKNAINNHAEGLKQKHQYLSVISGSGVRSIGFDKGKHKIVDEACIVMYVRAKGLIPLNESILPETLDGIKVDIREGEFQHCGLAQNYQTSLRMGCQIQCGKTGTLGCFLHHPQYGLCAITCAHVVLSDEELHCLPRDSKRVWQNAGKQVYQPDDSNRFSNTFGHVVETVIRSGDSNTPGVDLAIIQIEMRPPEAGHFPDNVQYADMSFESGQYCMSVSENNSFVTKFGRTTDKTDGYVQFSNAVVKAIDNDYKYNFNGREYGLTFHNQFEVRPSVAGSANNPEHFAALGDSGSPVFKRDVYGDFVCIGMLVGVLEPIGHGLVIPVSSIKSELHVSEFKDFRSRRIENRLSNIETSQQRIEGYLQQLLARR